MKINNFRGGLTDISAKKEELLVIVEEITDTQCSVGQHLSFTTEKEAGNVYTVHTLTHFIAF